MQMNMCERDILKDLQQEEPNKFYDFGDIKAMMNIGNYRKSQEDSVLVTTHNEFQDIEMLMVADGIGGEKNGGLASRLAAKQALYWFQELEKYELMSSRAVKTGFGKFVHKLDNLIRRKCEEGGTTMVCAFLLNESILIANIGDSRAYKYNEGTMTQITIDQSITQKLLKDNFILNKEHMRFHKKNNLIMSKIGGVRRNLELDFYEVSYAEVDKLFLFSDGVTDCISDKRLQQLIANGTHETICENIMNEVLYCDSYMEGLDPENYYDRILAGKDNASMVYKKNRRIR